MTACILNAPRGISAFAAGAATANRGSAMAPVDRFDAQSAALAGACGQFAGLLCAAEGQPSWSPIMKKLATLALALLVGTAAGAANARADHAGAQAGATIPPAAAGADASAQGAANGVGTTNSDATARIQSTSPQASDQGKAAVGEHTGTAPEAAGNAQAGDAAATGAGNAILATRGKPTAKGKAKGKAGTNNAAKPNTDTDSSATNGAIAPANGTTAADAFGSVTGDGSDIA
jgi:hypothetical protein